MKKIIQILLVLSLLACSIPVFAGTTTMPSGASISSKSVSGKSGSVQINGNIPVVDIKSNDSFESQVNTKITNVYNARVQEAEKAGASQVDFSFKIVKNGDECYLPIYSTIVTGSGKESVNTVNFDSDNNKMITLETIMGPNGTKLADKFVSSEIKKNPDYYSDFSGVGSSPDFYVENGMVTLLFDEYQIAPGSYGLVTMSMNLSLINEVNISTNDYYIKSGYNIKMIPLRKVCIGLGYEVGWDSATKAVTIQKGSFFTKVWGGQNKYVLANGSNRELESAPENRDDQLYVPISFFETILGASYTVDSYGNITFSQYN